MGGNSTDCYFNTTDFWLKLNFTGGPLIGIITIQCSNSVVLHMLPYVGEGFDNVITYIQIGDTADTGSDSCMTTASDWDRLSAGGDVRVLTIVNNEIQNKRHVILKDTKPSECHTGDTSDTRSDNCVKTASEEDRLSMEGDLLMTANNKLKHSSSIKITERSECQNMKNIGALQYINSQIQVKDFISQFSCLKRYENIAEVSFKHLSWSSFPYHFTVMFPNLQSLNLQNNKFTLPPSIFPWTEETVSLPRNLSRSEYMDDVYGKSFHLQIPRTIYKREFNLDHNDIKNLSEFRFHGFLHTINLAANGLAEIGENLFQNVTGLQSIRLDFNHLSELTSPIFRGLRQLRELDLSHNYLMTLNGDIFDDLTALIFLNLQVNPIGNLPNGLFKNLVKLKYLHLEHCDLQTIAHSTSLRNCLFLKELYLNGNYIASLPDFIFLFKELTLASFAHTNIKLLNLTDHIRSLNMSQFRLINQYPEGDLKQEASKRRIIDLSNCEIETLSLDKIRDTMGSILKLLLQHFHFILTSNPLRCDCEVYSFVHFVQHLNKTGSISGDEYYFNDWLCQSPNELRGRPLLRVQINEMYRSAENLDNCPRECKCHRRCLDDQTTIIIDCRKKHLDRILTKMPKGPLELWYSDNCISQISPRPYMQQVRVLNITNNRVSQLDDKVIPYFKNLRILDLRSNALTYLPESVKKLHQLEKVYLLNNSFVCDCKAKNMIHWIRDNNVVIDGQSITCDIQNEKKIITEITEDEFACSKDVNRHNYDPLYISCMIIFLSVVLFFLYVYRLECKVLLYIYFGLHPFDNKDEKRNEIIDCVIVHSSEMTDWVLENIVKHLESPAHHFTVFDMDRDFVVGFSTHENLSSIVYQSKRIIFCYTPDWNPTHITCKFVWNIAVKKIKETRSNYGIVVCKNIDTNTVLGKQSVKYIKRDRIINSADRLFLHKLIYAMPTKPTKRKILKPEYEIMERLDNNCFEMKAMKRDIYLTSFETLSAEAFDESQGHEHDVFISISYGDIEYLKDILQPLLEFEGYKLCIPDRDFLAGPRIEENIITAINNSKRTLFVLSNSHLQDEWSLFIFIQAHVKSLKEKNNHLMVIMKDEVDIDLWDEEIKYYLMNYVRLDVNDRWFKEKLLSGLPTLERLNEPEAQDGDIMYDRIALIHK